jgi:hypothetical protein
MAMAMYSDLRFDALDPPLPPQFYCADVKVKLFLCLIKHRTMKSYEGVEV